MKSLRQVSLSHKAFTLVEVMVVMAIIVILAALSTPVVSSLFAAGNANQSVNGISLTLDQARTYAMSHNTYVWVGLMQDSVTQTLTVGMLAGTSGRSSDLASSATVPIAKLQNYPFASIATVGQVEKTNPNSSWTSDLPSGTDLVSPSPFTGYTERRADGTTFDFSAGGWVLQFDPQGGANIDAGKALPHWIQFGLQPLRGTRDNSPNVAVIQVAGVSGQVRVFRP
jgi:prepilin-type N-terminal cleavage/methylation domain-containing protein